MPRIIAVKVGLLWIACVLNDYDETSEGRFGFTKNHAVGRVLWRFCDA